MNLELRKLAHEVYVQYIQGLNDLEYGANIIDELHAGENAHSRILKSLLQFNKNKGNPIYSSFLKLIQRKCDGYSTQLVANKPLIRVEEGRNGDGRIDVIIREFCSPKKFAIIIENKICNAIDQYKQIERYLDYIKNEGISDNSIFVIYLTSDGNKIISDYSLTEKAKKILGVTSATKGRFVELNYKYDILPWLEKDVLPSISLKEKLLNASVVLYIDYLKGIYNLREYDNKLINQIRNYLMTQFNISGLDDVLQTYEEVDFLHKQSVKILIDTAAQILEKHFYQPLQQFFVERGIKADISEKGNDALHFSCKIEIKDWDKCWLYISNDSQGTYFNLSHKCLENVLSEQEIEQLRTSIPYGCSSNWQPWWQYFHKAFYLPNDQNIWRDMENGTVFIKYKEWLDAILIFSKKVHL